MIDINPFHFKMVNVNKATRRTPKHSAKYSPSKRLNRNSVLVSIPNQDVQGRLVRIVKMIKVNMMVLRTVIIGSLLTNDEIFNELIFSDALILKQIPLNKINQRVNYFDMNFLSSVGVIAVWGADFNIT